MIHLTKRERRLGIGLLTVGVVWGLYGFVFEPTQDRMHTLQRVIPEKQEELHQVGSLRDEYLSLRGDVDQVRARMAAQDADFQLSSFIEGLIEKQKLNPFLTKMDSDMLPSQPGYTETLVTIDLEGIDLTQLVRFLETLESSDALAQVDTLHIHKDPTNPMRLNAIIQIHNTRLAAASGHEDLT